MLSWTRSAILLASVLAGAATALPASAQKKGGQIVYGNISGPGTLDPYVAGNLVELEVIHHLFETLVEMDENYNVRPMLASKVDTGDEAKTFTFALRHGVKFHNGKEMTSADVLASFQRYARVSTNAVLLADVDRYETPDPYTFIVRLKNTNAVFLDLLKTPTYPISILPAEQADKPGRDAEIIGTGPYQLGEWQKDSHLVIRRFDNYSADESAPGPEGFAGRKTAYLDSVRYNFVPEANSRVAALQSGQADVISDVSPDLVKRFASRADLAAQDVFPYCQQVFVTHATNGLTANPLIRKAIGAVVNVDDIIAASGSVVARRNHSLVYPESPYYPGDATAKYYDRKNVAEARELLKQAGYKGEKLVLQTNSNYAYMRDSIVVLDEMLKEAGFNTEVQITDWLTNSTNLQRGTGNWNVSTTGFCSQPLLGPQQWKTMVYVFPHLGPEPAMDAAYQRFFTSLDPAARKAAWLDIETRMLDQAYFIKVRDMGSIRGYNKKVEGMTPYYFLRFWNVSVK